MPILGIIASSYLIAPSGAARGLFGGGRDASAITNVIEYIDVETLGNGTDFGDLTAARGDIAGCASATRGLFMGGYTMPSYPNSNIIDFVTIASTGNATDFGDLTVATSGAAAGFNSSTRGVRAGGYDSGNTNVIDYVTIASAGNATDFGDLTVGRSYCAGASSSTRGLTMSGNSGGVSNVIDYVTIASAGNATDFGDAATARYYTRGGGSSTRAVFGAGQGTGGTFPKNIEYVTIATTGNATNFGDLKATNTLYEPSAVSSALRVVYGGGVNPNNGALYSLMRYITIATTGDATDFGDLIAGRTGMAGISNGNGGL